MCGRKTICLGVASFLALSLPAASQHRGGGMVAWHGHHGAGGHMHSHGSGVPVFGGYGLAGGYGPFPPFIVTGPGVFFPPVWPMVAPPVWDRGPLLPPPPPGVLAPPPRGNGAAKKGGDPARSAQLTTVGDRLFRAGNLKRAEERYSQAARAAPELASPRVRLAQVALVRGNYSEAAALFREAETAQPGWLITAPDIQGIYAEPGDFAKSIAKLESHLQTHPDDRDAWLVLGAEWFLSGRTAKAADVFQRLSDPKRKADVALAAFLAASNQGGAQAQKRPERRDN